MCANNGNLIFSKKDFLGQFFSFWIILQMQSIVFSVSLSFLSVSGRSIHVSTCFSLIDVRNWRNTDIFHCFLAKSVKINGNLRQRLTNTIMTGFSRALLKILPLVIAKTSQARSLL